MSDFANLYFYEDYGISNEAIHEAVDYLQWHIGRKIDYKLLFESECDTAKTRKDFATMLTRTPRFVTDEGMQLFIEWCTKFDDDEALEILEMEYDVEDFMDFDPNSEY